MRRCAYLTMEDPEGFFSYDDLTYPPLKAIGWSVDEIPWNRPHVDWSQYELVVIRSPWDYQQAPEQFLSVLEQIDASPARLENSLAIVRWNIDKTYLRELSEQGIPIVPTRWPSCLSTDELNRSYEEFECDELVVKPIVGANADDTYRIHRTSPNEAQSIALRTFENRPLMIQPFLHSIPQTGEYSLFYFAGQFSHAILKTPKSGDFRVQEEHGGTIQAVQPTEDLVEIGTAIMEAVPDKLLYARVDLVRIPDGQPVLIELELIEPSLYFPFHPEAPERFAQAIQNMMADAK